MSDDDWTARQDAYATALSGMCAACDGTGGDHFGSGDDVEWDTCKWCHGTGKPR